MQKLKLYVVKKSSSDKTFKNGDLIWLSSNGDLNNAMSGGWLEQNEWDVDGTNDFEYKISDTHYLDVTNGRERIKAF